jgi:hypothetical protein
MPKRYNVTWSPEDNTQPESTATFTKIQDDAADPCPSSPRVEVVSKSRRKALDEDRKNRDSWTCAELKRLLGVSLVPASHT